MEAVEAVPLALVGSARNGRRALLDMLLGMHGYQVTTFGDGNSVVDFLSGNRPELVILDHDLPGVSGVEISSRIRRSRHLASTPVALITDTLERMGGHEELTRLQESSGADIVMAEPLGKRQLIERLESITRDRHGRHPEGVGEDEHQPAPSSDGSEQFPAVPAAETASGNDDEELEIEIDPVVHAPAEDDLAAQATLGGSDEDVPLGDESLWEELMLAHWQAWESERSAARRDDDPAVQHGRREARKRQARPGARESARRREPNRQQALERFTGEHEDLSRPAFHCEAADVLSDARLGESCDEPNLHALLESRNIMKALIEEQSGRIKALQQRNVTVRRELERQRSRAEDQAEELSHLGAIVAEQQSVIEDLQERNVTLRHEVEQARALAASERARAQEQEALAAEGRQIAARLEARAAEYEASIEKLQELNGALWTEVEQRRADERDMREILQRMADREAQRRDTDDAMDRVIKYRPTANS